ncbi:MAG TPA: PASTA domain-containing protein, partial [Methylomirabilota bacterium]|nr:PASTA domain-containing protein [Methylomirabilota bacterium]
RRYSRAPGVLSFVGFAPADEPRFVMLVLLDEPKTERWGSEAAAPIFASVGREILRYLEVPPRDAQPVQIVRGSGAEVPAATRVRLVSMAPDVHEPGVVPDLRGRPLRRALDTLAALGLGVAVTGRGVVVQQSPAPGGAIEPGGRVQLTLAAPPHGTRATAVSGRGEPCESPCR